MSITRFLSLASNVRRAPASSTRLYPRIIYLGPLNPGHSPKEILKLCIGTFMMVDNDSANSSSTWYRVVILFLHRAIPISNIF
uniref:Uncharacterized protein n=1 Tax=Picea glauca TaxID=3330 RepID=A0A101M0X2_PICGL|nr:hypothetical protein ABT39_MTgene4204 [Picea glauca]QHR87054.1 hypothetical protein Q903MT_gene1063 [Picea sitchensis]